MNQPNRQPLITTALLVLGALAQLPAWAQYKVVKPDGSVTYTDHAPTEAGSRVTQLGRNGEAADSDAMPALPYELRSVVQRYPVTLYTAPDCGPCDSGRNLLLQRGVPFRERRVTTTDDAQALERRMGGRALPALAVGPQPVRGFTASEWSAYLDAAGYPRESKLPANWPVPTPLPLVEPRPVAPPQAMPAPSVTAATPPAPAASSSIRF